MDGEKIFELIFRWFFKLLIIYQIIFASNGYQDISKWTFAKTAIAIVYVALILIGWYLIKKLYYWIRRKIQEKRKK